MTLYRIINQPFLKKVTLLPYDVIKVEEFPIQVYKEGDLVITVYTIFHVRPILEKYESSINMTFCLKYGFEYLKCNLGQGGSLIDYKEYHTLNEDLAVQKTKELMDEYNENLP